MFDGLLNPSWPVMFGISLSFALFLVKFVTARSPKFDDIIVGLSDIPTVLTASACSLFVAAMARATGATYITGTSLVWLLIIFVMNVCIFRFVEKRKRSLSESWLAVSALIAVSFGVSLLLSVNVVSAAYAGMPK